MNLHPLIIGPAFPVHGRADLADRFDRLEALDAAYECEHGHLPGNCRTCDRRSQPNQQETA